jgi:DNA-binding LacI/PurR family transcriptional regulator
MKTLTIIQEHQDGEIWARIESENDFLLSTVGQTRNEITENLKDLLIDFIENEGQQKSEWKDVKIEEIEFMYQYDLTGFFNIYSAIKISEIARLAGINASLVRQYAKGLAYVSEKQVKKIEAAVKQLGKELMEVELV